MPIGPPPSLNQFAEWAEDTFAAIGTGTDMTIMPPRRDKRGYDFIAEWDVPALPGLARDRQKNARTARIQVKSNRQAKPVAKVSLTNCLRFAEAVDPCFIVLYWLHKKRGEVWIYAKHFGDELVERTLKRSREAEHEGRKDLHNIDLLIPMGEADLHTDDLTDWIKEECRDQPASYAGKKAHHHENVGYDESRLTGQIKFVLEDVPALIEHAVGLPTPFNPKWVELRDTRFGIPASTPLVAGEPAHFEIKSKPRPAAVIFKAPDGRTVKFDGEMRSFSLPGYEPPGALIASFLSTSITGRFYNDLRIDLNYHLKGPEVYDARHLQSLLRFFLMLVEGGVTATLTLENRRLDEVAINTKIPIIDRELYRWGDDMLTAMIGNIKKADKPKVSVAEMIDASSAVERLASCIKPGTTSLKVSLVPDHNGDVPEFSSLLAYVYAEVGSFTYSVFYRKKLLAQAIEDGTLVASFGNTEILDAWAKPGTLALNLPSIRKRFTQLRKKAPGGTVYLYDGDMVEALTNLPDASVAGSTNELTVTAP